MRVRRCAFLLIEPRENLQFDLGLLFAGDSALQVETQLYALAAHLTQPIALSAAGLGLLLNLSESVWQERDELCSQHAPATLDELIEAGLVLTDCEPASQHRQADEVMRADHWHPLSAVYHGHSRWSGMDTGTDPRQNGMRTIADMVATYGPPPPPCFVAGDPDRTVELPAGNSGVVASVAEQRYTCRNFDPAASLSLAAVATVLRTAFGALRAAEVAPGATVLKKRVPSGGSLHPVEAFVLAARVQDLAAGLYHYQPLTHRLVPLGSPMVPVRELALTAVAGQEYFADAPLQIWLMARFGRNFWKYRRHAKALRAIHLDAGHVSQMIYLAATELGLGAFVTAAINEIDIGAALQLDTLQMGPIAVCGIGAASAHATTIELHA